jgi:uncharacterized protein (TIGR03382 family)
MKRVFAIAGVVLGQMAGGANATLYSRNNGSLVYDDVLKITWLADWNSNAPNVAQGVDRTPGAMNWRTAKSWASTLVYEGFGGWRLPSAGNPSCGSANCAPTGEMGYMFYFNWGATEGNPFSTGSNTANLALFKNVQTSPNPNYPDYLSRYWTGTEFYYPDGSPVQAANSGAYYFNTYNGRQGVADIDLGTVVMFAVAVLDCDVAETSCQAQHSVPTPATIALLGLGLLGVGAARRKQA